MEKQVVDLLDSVYYDVNNTAGFASQKALYNAAKKKNKKITFKEVQQWWTTRRTPSRFQPARQNFLRPPFITRSKNHTYSGDMADLSKLASKNRGFKWFLICCDLFTRQIVLLVPQKSKSSKETMASLQQLFSKIAPKIFLTDGGTEFKGANLSLYFAYGIDHRVTEDSKTKSAIVERMIRTVKTRLFKIMDVDNSLVWYDKLDSVKDAINQSYNRTIGTTPNKAESMLPIELFYRTTQPAEIRNLQKTGKQKHGFFKYNTNDIVRIQRSNTFQKGFYGQWTSALYKIEDRKLKSFLPIYYLSNLLSGEKVKGSFGEPEINKVSIDVEKLPKIEQIFGKRLDRNVEQLQVKFSGQPGRKWVNVDSLIPSG